MTDRPPLLLHVGYHKTATTWMQRRLFQPEHGYRQLADHQEISDRVERPTDLTFDPGPMRNLIADRMAQVAPGEVPVLSSEILSGHPFQAGRDGAAMARRLARIAPGARILISIRAQARILPSVYMQYLLRGGTMPAERFFKGTKAPGYFGFDPVHFEYHRLVGLYQDLFGAGSVFVWTQESIARDMEAAAHRLADFAGAEGFAGLTPEARLVQSASYPEAGVGVLRRINHVQSSTLNPTPILRLGRTPQGLYRVAGFLFRRPPLSRILAGRRPVGDLVATRFAGHYAASNADLARISAHPLDLDGYDLPPGPALDPATDAPRLDPALTGA
ncbi:MAG: hypothetical protein AAF366_05720 [Pseudomonadota bacterium]